MKTEIVKYTDYQDNQQLIKSIMDLIEPSYKTAGKHITKDIEICNELYVMQSDSGQMLALFMIGYHNIGDTDFCYLGLSACKEEYKNNGFVKRLYLEYAKDCVKKELETNKRIYSYWTTATPIVYHWFEKYFIEVEPNRHGVCTSEGLQTLQKIATEKYHNAKFELTTPFVLRQAAHQINYSDNERQRIAKAIKDLNLTVFDTYKLDETQGDRFLMFGFCPSLDKINELLK